MAETRYLRMVLTLATLLLFSCEAVRAASTASCKDSMSRFRHFGNVAELLAESHGYAVLPAVGKGAFMIGGGGGSGCVFAGGRHTGYVTMAQLTIGWQVGGQGYSQLILFRTADAYREFTRGNFEFGADATAVALIYGAAAGATTQGASASAGDTRARGAWKRNMAVFILVRGGLMLEASIGGQKYNFTPLTQ